MNLFFTRFKQLAVFAWVATLATQMPTSYVQAQIVIIGADLPSVGITRPIQQQNLPDISLGEASSTAQVWNFSSLSGTPKTVEFVASSATPNGSAFSAATMARTGPVTDLLGVAIPNIGFDLGGLDGTAYYSIGSNGRIYIEGLNFNLSVAGFELGNQNLVTTEHDLYLTPAQFGQNVTNSGTYEQTIELDTLPIPITIQLNINKNITADAFGTAIMPNNAEVPVLRYAENTELNLVAGIFLFGFPITTFIDTSFSIQTYRFLTQDKQFPVLTANMNPTGLGPGIASVEYLDSQILSALETLNTLPTSALVFPNPSAEKVFVQLPNIATAQDTYILTAHNVMGQLVYNTETPASTQPLPISVADWPNGVYSFTLQNNRNGIVQHGRFTVAH